MNQPNSQTSIRIVCLPLIVSAVQTCRFEYTCDVILNLTVYASWPWIKAGEQHCFQCCSNQAWVLFKTIRFKPDNAYRGIWMNERYPLTLGITQNTFVCDQDIDRTIGSILTKVRAQVLRQKISVKFLNGPNFFNRLKMAVFKNVYRTKCVERLVVFENQSHQPEAS